ncbi:hypothetical protein AQUCO_00200010v1 [Aquilegia coerulea]|uniref:S-protein homolog n=1 Tax=Aquilegia coerulea TaxID=218851 RepID=A0A2G5F131_AQUCA|nr:hypothetical protein AQUCO_00200010v1 [Aquilegia coerulea]
MSSSNPNEYGYRLALLLMVFASYGCSMVCCTMLPLDKVYVQVHNSLARNQKLDINCKSKDNDLGSHTLSYSQFFSWHFNVNFWGTTLFWCQMEWRDDRGKYVQGSYNIFDFHKLKNKCDHQDPRVHYYYLCEWHIQRDGLYLFHNPDRNELPELIYTWPQHLDIQNRTILRKDRGNLAGLVCDHAH